MKLWEEKYEKFKGLFIIFAITLCVYLGFRYILPLILPFLFAYIIAWMIRPITEFLYRRWKIPRIAGASVSVIVLVTISGTGLYFLCQMIIKQMIAFIRNIPIYLNILSAKLDHLCTGCDELMGFTKGSASALVDDNIDRTIERIKNNIMPSITEQTISLTIKLVAVMGIIVIILISAILIVKEMPEIRKRYENKQIYTDMRKITDRLATAGIAYLRTQLIIMTIIAIICVLGLTLLKNNYALLIGVLIGFMDALPILGSGLILIPWGIITLFSGNIYSAAVLITLFLICQVIREILEPKLIGNRIGIKPLYTIISMYVGVKLFAIAGFILGPVGLIIIMTTLKVINDKSEPTSLANASESSYNEE